MTRQTPYLILPGRAAIPTSQWLASLKQLDLVALVDLLRYKGETSPAERDKALGQLQAIVQELLGEVLIRLPDEPVQLDLVFHAAELAGIPFEAAAATDRTPLMARPQPVVITRRVRVKEFPDRVTEWPVVPRVLFAWAEPDEEVPWREHRSALRQGLRPWIEPLRIAGFNEAVPDPDPTNILTMIATASLEQIREACAAASASDRPFSHVHVLAHGCSIGQGLEAQFGVALHSSEEGGGVERVSGADLARALCGEEAGPSVVTLAACDSANIENPVVGSSVAQELHAAGVPVVIGSQLPLGVEGSVTLVECFYDALFRGKDVRDALHEARIALLADSRAARYDWMSVVGYIQLPEGYARMLNELRLEAVMAALKTARRWYDYIIEEQIAEPQAFEQVADQLEARISDLTGLLDDQAAKRTPAVVSENRGLLGSAEKRLAELLWLRSDHETASDWRDLSRKALDRALHWYREAFFSDPSAHWSAIQYLSLTAILTGKISVQDWYAASFAASNDPNADEPYWSYSSRSELCLLAPFAGLETQMAEAEEQLASFRRLTDTRDDTFPLTSTRLQFGRYVHWWTSANGFFPGVDDLAQPATRLLRILD
jgi:hypothetical protein